MLHKLCPFCYINIAFIRLATLAAVGIAFSITIDSCNNFGYPENKRLDNKKEMRHSLYNIPPPKERCRAMSQKNLVPSKIHALERSGTLNRRAEGVKDALFLENDFFDPQDLLQVKYEMLRQARLDGRPITEVCLRFGFSRLSFYRLQAAFRQYGLAGLLSRKRGPRKAHKLSDEVMGFVETAKDEGLGIGVVKELIEARFGVRVHRRSIERALGRRKKN